MIQHPVCRIDRILQSPAVSRDQTGRRGREGGRSVERAAVAGAQSSYHRWFICKFSLLSADYEVTPDMIGEQHHNTTNVGQEPHWSREAVEEKTRHDDQ